MDRDSRRDLLPSKTLLRSFDRVDKSRKDAIKMFCIECVGNCEGYVRHIKDCSDTGCPLYAWRPYKGTKAKQSTKEEVPAKKKRKKCCDSPRIARSKKTGNKRCKNCGKKWKKKS